MTDYTARVERGAALLDARKPGWDSLIDLGELNMGDGDRCIFGQTFGDEFDCGWSIGTRLLLDDSLEKAVEHGFYEPGNCDYAGLDAEWRSLIESRRAVS